jgi:dipeptidyl aminopeptidase/acylaminoacyl peptidase
MSLAAWSLLCSSLLAHSWDPLILGIPRECVQDVVTHPASAFPEIARRMAKQYPAPVSLSSDGAKLLLRTAKWDSDELSVVDVHSGQMIASTTSKDSQLGISWSSDGREIAYLAGLGNDDAFRLYIWDLSNDAVRQLNAPVTNVAVQPPRWSPDGRQLAYLVGSFDDSTIWIVNLTEQTPPHPLVAHVCAKSDFEWAPDGKQLAIVLRSSPSTLRLISAQNGQQLQQISLGQTSRSEIRDISWAPSGQALVVAGRVATDYMELQRLELRERKITLCVTANGNVNSPRIADDNQTIVYALSKNAEIVLYSSTCEGRASTVMGFDSGTTRFIRFLRPTHGPADHSIPFAALHASLSEPPGLYLISTKSGRADLIFRPLYSSQLLSPRPKLIGIPNQNGAPTPAVYWPAAKATASLATVIVDIHGGPHLETSLRWEFLPSLLTNMGVDLISPNYRGSSGYGYSYEESGAPMKQIDEIVAVCKFARKLYGSKTRVILVGTSYGSFLAAAAAASDPQDVSGLVLLSLVDVKAPHQALRYPSFPIAWFQGENDHLSPQQARSILSSFFEQNDGSSDSIALHALTGEGHVCRHAASWDSVYSAIVHMVMHISDSRVELPSNLSGSAIY